MVEAPYLVFSCGADLFAVLAGEAVEVVQSPPLTWVPATPDFVLGVFAHRGEMASVFDLARLLGRAPRPWQRLVLLRVSQGLAALTASEVQGITQLMGEVEEGPSAAFQRGPFHSRYGPVTLLDVEGLLGEIIRARQVALGG